MTTDDDTRLRAFLNPESPTIQARLYRLQVEVEIAISHIQFWDSQRPESRYPVEDEALGQLLGALDALVQLHRGLRLARHAYNRAHGL